MRISTALALRVEDIDLSTMEIVARRRLSEGVETPGVKRDRFGEDAPPLLPEVHEALKKLWASYNEKQRASGLVFAAHDGRHHNRTLLREPFKDICSRAGITKRFTPHGCRRTGEKLYGKTVGTRLAMEIAGHTTERMHRHYTPADAAEKQAAARAAFGGLKVVSGGKV
jgi:integrase